MADGQVQRGIAAGEKSCSETGRRAAWEGIGAAMPGEPDPPRCLTRAGTASRPRPAGAAAHVSSRSPSTTTSSIASATCSTRSALHTRCARASARKRRSGDPPFGAAGGRGATRRGAVGGEPRPSPDRVGPARGQGFPRSPPRGFHPRSLERRARALSAAPVGAARQRLLCLVAGPVVVRVAGEGTAPAPPADVEPRA